MNDVTRWLQDLDLLAELGGDDLRQLGVSAGEKTLQETEEKYQAAPLLSLRGRRAIETAEPQTQGFDHPDLVRARAVLDTGP